MATTNGSGTNGAEHPPAASTYSPYCIPLNFAPLRKPRRLRVVCVGAGFAGMTLAYKVQNDVRLKDMLDLQIYERQGDAGGTWQANRYPGLYCDVPIHVYTLPWAPKSDWRSFMASGEEIKEYIEEVCDKFGLRNCMRFKTEVIVAKWNEEKGEWGLSLKDENGDFEDRCDILIGATGTQSTPIAPDIPGIKDFKGPIAHTGDWDKSLDCNNKRIAVIGNGSSGIQAFGALQPKATQITHFIRTPTWIAMNYMSQFTRDGSNFNYSPEEKERFSDPQKLYEYRQTLESTSNALFQNLVFDLVRPESKKNFRAATEKSMRSKLAPELQDSVIPKYQPWCRRLTPGDDYLPSLQKPNAALVASPITRITETGIVTKDGEERAFDVLVTATGFKNSRTPPYRLIGAGGTDIENIWTENTDAYISACVPRMPNFFTIGCGPNFVIANGSVLSALGFLCDYVLAWCRKIACEDIKAAVVRDSVVEEYNLYLQQILRQTAWNRECDSWYKKGKRDEYRTGITAIYPGSMNHFREMLAEVRGEDFEITYRSSNRWKFYGNGLTEYDLEEGADLASYLKKTMRLENMM